MLNNTSDIVHMHGAYDETRNKSTREKNESRSLTSISSTQGNILMMSKEGKGMWRKKPMRTSIFSSVQMSLEIGLFKKKTGFNIREIFFLS